MVFPYKLMEGVSATRNAIRLLEQMGFPAEVIREADAMAAKTSAAGTIRLEWHPRSVCPWALQEADARW